MNEWLFHGDAQSLDFVNTLRDRWSTDPQETLSASSDLGRWAVMAGIADQVFPATEGELLTARRLRRAVYELVRPGAPAPERAHVELVNRCQRLVPDSELAIDERTGQVSVTSPSNWSAQRLLGVIADDFIGIVRDGGLLEIKECAHHRCGLLFRDSSRGSRRQWCSMSRCGNRAKAQRHAQRSPRPGGTLQSRN